VVATILPLHALAAGVMTGVGQPHLLLKPGMSPHRYSLRPRAARMLAGADVIVWVGPQLERFLVKPLASLAPAAQRIAIADAANETHPWLDPDRAIALVERLAQTLAAIDPDRAALYAENAARVTDRLTALDTALADRLAPVRGRAFMTYHDALAAFARHYRLKLVGALTLTPERQPGARTIAAARAQLLAGQVKCLFVEPQVEPALARRLVAGTGVRLGVVDPLGAELTPGEGAYTRLLERLAEDLRRCLEGQ